MDDPHDQYEIAFNPIEYPVPPLCKAAQMVAQFRLGDTGERTLPQQRKRLIETAEICVRYLRPKFREAEVSYLDQICARGGAKP
jgi:hypothetical protein